ncbi:MAG: thiol:disulfide interchange protein DsbA/DsbL [Deltaproteobacteria bacterium]|jgi:thiol:disulfide interchange protein DsbA|nr:thiol:disulfide interchange protein DsbA/DsbL [Deltaproteobacteria bacterium]
MRKTFLLFLLLAIAAGGLWTTTDADAQLQHQAFSAVLNPQRYDDSDDKIEVVYFFWYGCSHCYDSDKTTSLFLSSLPSDVRVVRLPAIFDPNDDSAFHARLYYSLRELGAELNLRTNAFLAVQNMTVSNTPAKPSHSYGLISKQAQESFAVANGISRAEYSAAYDSDRVIDNLTKAKEYYDAVEIRAVPTMIVNGRYILPYSQTFYQVAEQLINQERERLASGEAQ